MIFKGVIFMKLARIVSIMSIFFFAQTGFTQAMSKELASDIKKSCLTPGIVAIQSNLSKKGLTEIELTDVVVEQNTNYFSFFSDGSRGLYYQTNAKVVDKKQSDGGGYAYQLVAVKLKLDEGAFKLESCTALKSEDDFTFRSNHSINNPIKTFAFMAMFGENVQTCANEIESKLGKKVSAAYEGAKMIYIDLDTNTDGLAGKIKDIGCAHLLKVINVGE